MTENLTLSITEVQRQTGLGRTKLYEILKSGELPARKLGRRTLILKSDLENFLANLTPYPTKEGGQNDK